MKLNDLSPDDFEKLCGQLFSVMIPGFEATNRNKDQGVDGYVSNESVFAIYCPERNLTSSHKVKIKADVGKLSAFIKQNNIKVNKWIYVTPEDVSTAVSLYAHQICKEIGIESECWGSTKLLPLIRQNPEIQNAFPKLVELELSKNVEKISNDTSNMSQKISAMYDYIFSKSGEILPISMRSKSELPSDENLEESFRLWSEGKLVEALRYSKKAYYSIKDSVRLQAIMNILLLTKDESNEIDYLISLTGEGIALANAMADRSAVCAIKARKGNLLGSQNYLISIKLMEDIMFKQGMGLGTLSLVEQKELINQFDQNGKEMDALFTSATSEALDLNDYKVLAFIKMTHGMTFSLTYINMANSPFGSSKSQLGKLKHSAQMCFSDARRLYASINDLSGEIFVIHNLAASMLMFGENELAKQYSDEALSLSASINDGSIKISAGYLQSAINRKKF